MANQRKGIVRPCDCKTCRDHPRSAEAREHKQINRMVSTLDEKNLGAREKQSGSARQKQSAIENARRHPCGLVCRVQ
jgi:hypothetical protein